MENREIINNLRHIRNWKCNGDSDMYATITAAISALEQQEKDKWTPVAEDPKKPKYQFDTYLIYTKYRRFGVADFFVDGRWIGYDIDDDLIDGDQITAWRPLPEPYQEGEA